LRALTEEIYKARDSGEQRALKGALKRGGHLLGILQREDLQNWLNPVLDPAAEWRIQERAQARREHRFADADRIRAELAADGIILEDKPDGTIWRRQE
jgi:cysteinyl-tRNA synthetase